MKRLLPLLFALIKFFSGFLLYSSVYELQRDEYLYLDQGRHLAWGYLEVPPLIAAQGWVSMALGGSFFWVKFWPFLWGAATIYLLTRLVQRLGGGWFATVLAGACYLGTAYARLNLLFQPNSFEVFGFVFCLYWLVAYFQTEKPRYLYLLGLGLGLSMLNKYSTLFFLAALGGALLLTPRRRLLLSRHFWGAAALGLLVWLPNLAWQISHGIPFLHHMKLLHDTQLVHVDAIDFWKPQLLMCLPALWVWVPGLLALLLSAPFRPYRAVGLVTVLGVGLLAVLHGKDYYTLGYYPVLFGFGALWWEMRLQNFRWKKVLQPVLVLAVLLPTLPMLPFIYPVRPPAEMAELAPRYQDLGFYRWEDGQNHALPQDYADMLGWQELADQTWAAYQSLPADVRPHTLIHCANYGQAGAINYFNRHRGLPTAHSMNGSYLFWYPTPQDVRAIIIVDDEPDDELAPRFASYRRFGQLGNPYAREQGALITLGLQPDSLVLNQIRREQRNGLAAWQGKAY
jgi:hypothetical protein